ncbi:MAG: TolC family protein [Bdellovibrio sp.]|nr:TolC family protein [Bdellovibrio sp.]
MNLKLVCTAVLTTVFATSSFAMTLEEYLQIVKKKNKVFSSLAASVEASNSKAVAGDVVLAPVLTAGYSLSTDKSLPSSIGDKREVSEYNLGVSKKFITGTTIGVSGKTDEFRNDTNFTTTPGLDKYSTGGLGVTLQQSLWKDFFGAGTRIRQDLDRTINQIETVNLDLQMRAALFDAESTFWDYTVADEDLKLQQANFDRAKKMEQWTSNRVTNGISDRADLMNVRALAALREVQLSTAQDEIKMQEAKFREYLELADGEPTPVATGDIMQARNYMAQLSKNKDVIKMDAYLSSLQAKSKKLVADQIGDLYKPDLALLASYNTSSYDREYSEMTKNIAKTDRPRTFIGVNFTWMFDTDAKLATINSAQKDALASKYAAERAITLGKIAWSDLQRKYETTSKNVLTLEKVAKFQRERAKAEQDKFGKGRTITSNVVLAETDAAEAEVNLLRAKSGLRKLEASSILFIAL